MLHKYVFVRVTFNFAWAISCNSLLNYGVVPIECLWIKFKILAQCAVSPSVHLKLEIIGAGWCCTNFSWILILLRLLLYNQGNNELICLFASSSPPRTVFVFKGNFFSLLFCYCWLCNCNYGGLRFEIKYDFWDFRYLHTLRWNAIFQFCEMNHNRVSNILKLDFWRKM